MTQKEIKETLDSINDIDLLNEKINEFKNEGIDEKVLTKYINKVKKHEDKVNKIMVMKMIEENYLKDYDYVVGIDEVGRGPLAGPVVTCCIAMSKLSQILDVDDSKKLTEEVREGLFDEIKEESILIGIGENSAEVIDERNILDATFDAMNKAFIEATKSIPKDKKILVLIDGNLKNPYIECDQVPIIKGDSKVYSIACASIVAKVTRDRMMNELDKDYPEYGFIENKGYGTEKHRKALKEIGPVEGLHRKSFIKNLI